jgi:hypothetical protein
MTLKKLADDTVAALEQAFPTVNTTEEERQKISRIIEKTLIKTVEQTTLTHHKATKNCCGPEADIAHKISEEVRRANIALTANLMALR